jgi:glycosyltransferase involved in cell wall biosynthesis
VLSLAAATLALTVDATMHLPVRGHGHGKWPKYPSPQASLPPGCLYPLATGKWPNGHLPVRKTFLGPREMNRLRGGAQSMTIALCAWESLHSIAVGGVAPHVTELAAGLVRRGHEVHLFTRANEVGGSHMVVDGVHVHLVPFDLASDMIDECNNMCNAFTYFLRQSEHHMQKSFDIIHCHDWLAAKALVQLKQAGRRCILTMHSTEFGRSGNVHHEGGDSARIREIEREGCEYADKVIAVSGRLCDEVKMFNCGHKLRMVYNGVQLHHFEGFINAGEFKAKYGIGPLQPMVLFVGRLALQKGPDILIDAIPGILSAKPDAVMVLVGDGHMRGDLERRVKDMEKGHAVRFVGSQAGQELRNFYKAADCVVVPSRNEPFGIVVSVQVRRACLCYSV